MLCAREVWRWVMQHFDRKETGAGYPVLSQDIVVKRKTMACMLNFALLVLAFVSLAAATVPYETAYFEQNLDHFNFVQDKTFKQRYIYTGKSACILLLSSSVEAALSFYLFKNYFQSNTPPSPNRSQTNCSHFRRFSFHMVSSTGLGEYQMNRGRLGAFVCFLLNSPICSFKWWGDSYIRRTWVLVVPFRG